MTPGIFGMMENFNLDKSSALLVLLILSFLEPYYASNYAFSLQFKSFVIIEYGRCMRKLSAQQPVIKGNFVIKVHIIVIVVILIHILTIVMKQ